MSSDIQSKIRRDFPSDEFHTAIEEIQRWDTERKGLLEDRLIRCAVYLARGSLDRLKQQVALGMRDYRDLIVAAEYDGDVRVRDFTRPFTKNEERA